MREEGKQTYTKNKTKEDIEEDTHVVTSSVCERGKSSKRDR